MLGTTRGIVVTSRLRLLFLAAGAVLAIAACAGGDSPPWGASPSPTALPVAQTPASPTVAAHCTPHPYTVQAGDTLSGIASAFNVPLEDVVRLNSETIPDPDSLAIGQVVNIPCPKPSNNTAPTATPVTP